MKIIALLITWIFATCNAEPGPCPDFPVMENYDLAKRPSTWTSLTVYASKGAGEPQYKCSTSVHTLQPDNSSFLQMTAQFTNKSNEINQVNATCTPVPGKPGVFNVKHEEVYEFLGEMSKSAEMKFYVLDTDFESYSIGLSCFGDGQTSHTTSAVIDYKNRSPPAVILEKAARAFKKAGLNPWGIKAVDQTNCPNN